MREIKFRAISTRTLQWIYGSLVRTEGENYIVEPDERPREHPGEYVDCIDLSEIAQGTEGQWTGLKDKGGKEIYKGDIVKNHWWGDGDVGFLGEEWVVKFGKHESNGNDVYTRDAYGWYYESKGETFSLVNLPQSKGIEIVGNIYENPDFVEVV